MQLTCNLTSRRHVSDFQRLKKIHPIKKTLFSDHTFYYNLLLETVKRYENCILEQSNNVDSLMDFLVAMQLNIPATCKRLSETQERYPIKKTLFRDHTFYYNLLLERVTCYENCFWNNQTRRGRQWISLLRCNLTSLSHVNDSQRYKKLYPIKKTPSNGHIFYYNLLL